MQYCNTVYSLINHLWLWYNHNRDHWSPFSQSLILVVVRTQCRCLIVPTIQLFLSTRFCRREPKQELQCKICTLNICTSFIRFKLNKTDSITLNCLMAKICEYCNRKMDRPREKETVKGSGTIRYLHRSCTNTSTDECETGCGCPTYTWVS